MKRYFQILFGGGLLSLLAIQSYGVVTVGNSFGNNSDSSYTFAHWNDTQQDGGRILAYRQADTLLSAGNNDVFRFSVDQNFTGMLTVVDIGSPSDRYNILDFNNGLSLIGTTGFGSGAGAFNNSGNLQSPTAALADDNYHRFEWNAIAPGQYDIKIEREFGSANSGGVALRFEAIPEPSVSLLAMLGLVGLVIRRRRS